MGIWEYCPHTECWLHGAVPAVAKPLVTAASYGVKIQNHRAIENSWKGLQ